MTTAVLFPGQGSQRAGMGDGLFDRFAGLESQASQMLGYSVRDLCLYDRRGQLGDTRYTQPARYVVNALSLLAATQDGLVPDVLLGHSVGEYNALAGAGVLDFATGLELVAERARLMAEVPGGMSVVLGLDARAIAEALAKSGLSGIDLANLNAVDQVVLAGPADQLAEAAARLLEAGAFSVRPLLVSGPFHSRYMRVAADKYARVLGRYALAPPRLPVIANRTAREYPAEPAAIAQILGEQIDHHVRWAESLAHVLSLDPGTDFVELGGPATLGSTVRRARQQLTHR
jgi:malonyl CoA-acyl carrier protein transacylase